MFTARSSVPPVTIWKNAMIAISANNRPYSRRCAFRYSPMPLVSGSISVVSAIAIPGSPYSVTMSDMMRSWLASSVVSSPTRAPSFIT